MKIAKIDQALEACEEHIARTSTAGTEIEALLTRAVLVLACSAFEEEIERMIENRADNLHDPAMAAFFKSCVSAVFRSTKSSELAGLLNRFGADFKTRFQDRSRENEKAVTFYNNIVVNRHGVAHTQSINVTLAELRQFYEEGHVVLDFLKETLKETCPGCANPNNLVKAPQ